MIDQERLIKTLLELVRIDSPSGEEQAMANDLIVRLENLGFDVGLDGYGNVIGKLGNQDAVLLSAHMDTVEPGRGINPSVQGTMVVSEDTTILGGDCKAGIAAILEGLTAALESGDPVRSVEVAFTRQEEIGLVGAQNLDFSRIKAQKAVVFDGEGPPTQITSSSPTHVSFEVDVTGRAAHAGVEPEKGLSSIRVSAELIVRLPQGRIDDETTFNIGIINGGSVTNAVPEKTKILGEFRSHNPEAISKISDDVNNAIENVRVLFPEAILDLAMNTRFEAYSIDENDAAVEMLTAAFGELGKDFAMLPSGGGTDGNVLRMHGISAAVVGMADHNAHTVREYVSIPELVDAANLCEVLVREN